MGRATNRFSHLSPGEYLVAVVAQPWYAQHRPDSPGELDVAYPIVFNSGVSNPGDAVPIVLQDGERAEADAVLRPLPALHIVVSNASPDPSWPGSATLMAPLYGGFTSPIPTESTTINGSVIEITGIPPGRYVIDLQSFGGESPANRNRELDLFSNMEIDGNEI